MKTDPPKDPRLHKRRIQFSIWYLVAAVVVVLTIQSYLTTLHDDVAYSEFKTWVREGKVASVVVSPDTIRGELRPEHAQGKSSKFRVERGGIEDKDLEKLLEDSHVHVKGEAQSMFLE